MKRTTTTTTTTSTPNPADIDLSSLNPFQRETIEDISNKAFASIFSAVDPENVADLGGKFSPPEGSPYVDALKDAIGRALIEAAGEVDQVESEKANLVDAAKAIHDSLSLGLATDAENFEEVFNLSRKMLGETFSDLPEDCRESVANEIRKLADSICPRPKTNREFAKAAALAIHGSLTETENYSPQSLGRELAKELNSLCLNVDPKGVEYENLSQGGSLALGFAKKYFEEHMKKEGIDPLI
jgi:hypothetical protein